QRVAIVGPNGAGKTTLLKMLAEVIPIDGGERKLGDNVRMGYFAQDHAEMLSGSRTVLAEMLSVADAATAPHMRGLLGAFLFSGDAVEKRVVVLWGGAGAPLRRRKVPPRAAELPPSRRADEPSRPDGQGRPPGRSR